MKRWTRTVGGVGALALVASLAAFTANHGPRKTALHGAWKIEATGARIIGGYGDNFAYKGDNVRPLNGSATMTVDAEAGKAMLEINVETTDASGPIRFSADKSFSGKIRIVQKLDTSKMAKARIEEDVFLHGDTGNEAPVMPTLYNYFATWGPAKIFVNGEEAVPMIGSHTMFSERSRGEDGAIVNPCGAAYSPMGKMKKGFTDPKHTEFHFVAHTTKPDKNNFPPHTAWIHLNFSDVKVIEHPADEKIPYQAD